MSRKLVLLAFISFFIITALISYTTSSQSLCNKRCLTPQSGTVYYPNASVSRTLAETVHNLNTGLNYTTIQAAVDAPETLNGHTIFVEEGMYYEHVVVNKSLSLIGEDRSTTIIDGNKTSIVVLVSAHSVTIKKFTVQNGTTGIYVDHSNDSIVMKNDIIGNADAISMSYSNNCTINHNFAANNAHRGILITNSRNFTVSNNHVYGNGWYGINANASANGIIAQNNVYENYYDGIGLLDSNNCTIAGNNISDNMIFGVWLDSSHDSFVYHNNFLNNNFQATTNTLTNHWDNGLEGNHWNNYAGTDYDRDGIGDDAYISNEVKDNFPLMGMFSSFNTSLGYHVNVISNSTIGNFQYFESNGTIRMYASNMTASQTYGFCRIRIPHALMSEPYNVTVDGANPTYWNYTLYDDGDNRWIYFNYEHSTLEIIIIPEFPSFLLLPLFMIATLLTVIMYRKNCKVHRIQEI
ncbi:hypothetical protein E3J49_03900 [Candidatus Bathyarchaeota archaeon]|nr:MAG: hypothetical protein E3J49_03900 [Candidatus Bathyarchaeota archaeon]